MKHFVVHVTVNSSRTCMVCDNEVKFNEYYHPYGTPIAKRLLDEGRVVGNSFTYFLCGTPVAVLLEVHEL